MSPLLRSLAPKICPLRKSFSAVDSGLSKCRPKTSCFLSQNQGISGTYHLKVSGMRCHPAASVLITTSRPFDVRFKAPEVEIRLLKVPKTTNHCNLSQDTTHDGPFAKRRSTSTGPKALLPIKGRILRPLRQRWLDKTVQKQKRQHQRHTFTCTVCLDNVQLSVCYNWF